MVFFWLSLCSLANRSQKFKDSVDASMPGVRLYTFQICEFFSKTAEGISTHFDREQVPKVLSQVCLTWAEMWGGATKVPNGYYLGNLFCSNIHRYFYFASFREPLYGFKIKFMGDVHRCILVKINDLSLFYCGMSSSNYGGMRHCYDWKYSESLLWASGRLTWVRLIKYSLTSGFKINRICHLSLHVSESIWVFYLTNLSQVCRRCVKYFDRNMRKYSNFDVFLYHVTYKCYASKF